MTTEIQYLSYSSINLYLTCGEAWRRKYIAKEPQVSTPSLVVGSAIHNTIEDYIKVKTTEGIAAPLVDLWSGYHWAKALEAQPDVEWGADLPEQHYNEGLRLLANPELQQMVNRLTPKQDESGLWIERKVELRVPGVPIPIIGYIDIVTNDGVPGDFKTSAQMWTQDEARDELQPLFYLAALNQLGHTVPGLRFRHYVMTKAKQPKVQMLETQHTWDSIFWLYDLITHVWEAIENEVYVPNPHAWLCGPKYCAAWSKCRGKGL